MKVVLQKVKRASVSVEKKVVGEIERGYCLFVGVHKDSTEKDAKYLAKKIVESRLFSDKDGKLNLSLKEVSGKILSISQFTLYADTKKGKRPSFSKVANSQSANELYEIFNNYLKEQDVEVETGVFQTEMEVDIVNDGPVTIIYEKLSEGNM